MADKRYVGFLKSIDIAKAAIEGRDGDWLAQRAWENAEADPVLRERLEGGPVSLDYFAEHIIRPAMERLEIEVMAAYWD